MNSIIKDYCKNNATNVLDNDEYELVNLLFKEKYLYYVMRTQLYLKIVRI